MSTLPSDGPRRVALALTVLLVAVLIGWHVARLSSTAALIACVITVGPWLLTLPGLLAPRRRGYQAAAILTSPYIVYGLMDTLANQGARVYAGATVLVAFALFVALVHALRASPWPAPLRAPPDRAGRPCGGCV